MAMKILIFIMGVVSVILLGIYAVNLTKHRFNTKEIVMIGLVAAISFVLSMVHFFTLPQGGSITLFSMLPIMLFALMYDTTSAVTAGVVFGLLSLISDFYVIHPIQLLLDYPFPAMALGLAGIFGSDTRGKRLAGPLLAVVVNFLAHFLSGYVFFGDYAPAGMGTALYSCIYNFWASGFEGILCVILIGILPIERIRKYSGIMAK